MREGIRSLIAGQTGMSVVAEAHDGSSAVQKAAELLPDVIIMDVSMPRVSGIEAARQLSAEKTASKIIALSMHLDTRVVLEMIAAGASGYLLKDCVFEEVLLAVQTVMSGGMYLSPGVLECVLKDFAQRAGQDGPSPLEGLPDREWKVLSLLTGAKSPEEFASVLTAGGASAGSCLGRIMLEYIVPRFAELCEGAKARPVTCLDTREREILAWIRAGKSTWETSSILGLSQDTVKYHLKKIYQKLNATNRAQAVAVALDNKLIDA